jgi:hypothetical protein
MLKRLRRRGLKPRQLLRPPEPGNEAAFSRRSDCVRMRVCPGNACDDSRAVTLARPVTCLVSTRIRVL